ncbi:DeoR/GlpR transcriptional regulator [Vibrio sp. S9_S30]|uniref:DeoR/GlpR family DNA-binding transcription regulator n=1 Tax=Vibrio sp. S9_S30 TaxID=2720226 RepID=UPI001681655B|nr:DeoR/GlpR family DNA-binding transcription regulator [Vibrio sp. S9_S30]MBD1558159.1 DeoR/GlpR transcriptional regulator [Vibrio sp. S9_S30]
MLEKTLSKKEARQAKIVDELHLFPQIKVQELVESLNVSPETIRRDLAALSKQGKISRTFGGAVSLSAAVPGISERQSLMIKERDQISEMATSLIRPNDLLMVGGGSTTMRFALKIAALKFPITIVTHSLPFATTVSKNPNVSVEILPGKLNASEGLTVGSNTINTIRKFSAHKAFVGASGVNESGLYALMEPGEIYSAMIDSAEKTYLLIDSSKYDATSLAQYQEWNPKLTVISDKGPSDNIMSAMQAASVDILLPKTPS